MAIQSTIYIEYYNRKVFSHAGSSAIPIPLKMKPQLENIVLELTTKTMPMGILPLTVHNCEGNILKFKRKTESSACMKQLLHMSVDVPMPILVLYLCCACS